MLHPVGFEPTPPKRIELESIALDHSATDAFSFTAAMMKKNSQQRDSNSRPPVYETDALTTMLCWHIIFDA